MEKTIQYLLDKYEPKTLNSIKLENNILDIEKEIIFENESQIPNFVLNSSCPFDKNYCFYDISLKASTKENIFPKEKYFLKTQQIVELKPIDINKIFEDDTMFKNDLSISPEDKKKEEKKYSEELVHQKIISLIKSNHYKSYTPKNLEKKEIIDSNANEFDNEWYIIENDIEEGPFNDFQMYNKLYKIFYDLKGKFPNYLLKEKKSDIFMTMNDCFDRLRTKYEFNKQNTANNEYFNQLKLQFMNNLLIYNTQMLKYYQINAMNTKNSLNNKNSHNINKSNNAPNKFDNTSKKKRPVNTTNNKFNNNRKFDYRNENNKFNNNMDNKRWNNSMHNNKGKKINNNIVGKDRFLYYNQHQYQNKYNKKEKRVDKEHDEKKKNYLKNKKEKDLEKKKSEELNQKDEANKRNNIRAKEGPKLEHKINVEEFFEK